MYDPSTWLSDSLQKSFYTFGAGIRLSRSRRHRSHSRPPGIQSAISRCSSPPMRVCSASRVMSPTSSTTSRRSSRQGLVVSADMAVRNQFVCVTQQCDRILLSHDMGLEPFMTDGYPGCARRGCLSAAPADRIFNLSSPYRDNSEKPNDTPPAIG